MRKNNIPLIFFLISLVWLSTSCTTESQIPSHITLGPSVTSNTQIIQTVASSETDIPTIVFQATDTLIPETEEFVGTSTTSMNINDHLIHLAETAVENIKLKDFEALSKMIHPGIGVRLSPYAYLRDEDIFFSANDFARIDDNPNIYNWGYYDGSGEPIDLSFSEYYDRFVYDVDFVNADMIALNERVGFGNTIINILDVYPKAVFIEFYIEGKNPAYAGMDWRSLRLVFMEDDGNWWLIAIVHDEWTI